MTKIFGGWNGFFAKLTSHSTILQNNDIKAPGKRSKTMRPEKETETKALESTNKADNNCQNEEKLILYSAAKEVEKSTPIPEKVHLDQKLCKGKLHVTIIEVKNMLMGAAISHPYLVCSFENSQFISGNLTALHKNNSEMEDMLNHISEHLLSSEEVAQLVMHSNSTGASEASVSNYCEILTKSLERHCGQNSEKEYTICFDVSNPTAEIDLSVYDVFRDDLFLGSARIRPGLRDGAASDTQWIMFDNLVDEASSCPSALIHWEFVPENLNVACVPEDFEILRLLGTGTFGKVYQVAKKDTQSIYAMKVLSKSLVVKNNEIEHTLNERNILVHNASNSCPFILSLKFAFQTSEKLYLVMDFMNGGELFWHLQTEGHFSEVRTKFYVSELILALQFLHDNGIIYRDLKSENILLDANGNIALCDFGLSKIHLNGRAKTFCGTTEYLAPELLLDQSGYTQMVDFWSLGVLMFEMRCGWSPFYADTTEEMFDKIIHGKVKFSKRMLSKEGCNFLKTLLNRNPDHRLGAKHGARELKVHPYMADVDWDKLFQKKITPPFKPHITSKADTRNFDPTFTQKHIPQNDEEFLTPLSSKDQTHFEGFTYVHESVLNDGNRIQDTI